MATAGGLEIHMEIAHKAGAPVAAPASEAPLAVAAVPPVREAVPLERPRKTGDKNRAAVPAIAFAVIALLIARVASVFVRNNEGPTTPLAMVQASASTTADAGTARVWASANGISIDGGFDFDSRRATMTVDGSKFGAPEIGKIEAVVDYASGLVMYMKFPPQLTADLGGKSWVKFDVGTLLKQSGVDVDLSSLTQGESADPTNGLGMLRGADNVTTVGTETVRGVDTTHYHLVVNIDKALAEAPVSQRDALSKLVSLYTVHTLPADVWLDSDGRVRRFQETVDAGNIRNPAGVQQQFKGALTVTYEMYDFGAPVDVKIPPADQTADLSQLLKNAGN